MTLSARAVPDRDAAQLVERGGDRALVAPGAPALDVGDERRLDGRGRR